MLVVIQEILGILRTLGKETDESSATTTEDGLETSNEDNNNIDTESTDISSADSTDQPETDTEQRVSSTTDNVATTTEVILTTTEEIVEVVGSYVVNDQNRYQFGTNECIPVGDGSFYCNDNENTEGILEDAVYAAVDIDGDKEIYIRKDGIDHKNY